MQDKDGLKRTLRNGWREVAIGDIADVVGGSTPSTKDAANFDGDVPWLTPKDLSIPHDRYIGHGERSISQKGLENCSARLLPPGAVLLSTRAPIGYVALAKNPIATNQGFRSLVVRAGVSSDYLYYWLLQNTDELKRHASGSTFGELSGSSLKTLRIILPPLTEQRAIAHVLGTLDAKIELNRRTNETLETMARTMFKSWFLDFDPVRAKMEGSWRRGESLPGLPAEHYDLFPDRLVDSELGEIPEGWQVKTLGDVAGQRRVGVMPDQIAPDTPYIALEHVPRRCITLAAWGSADGLASGKFRFKKGDILFGKLRPYFHKVGVAPTDGVCSTDIVVLTPISSQWFGFLLGHASSKEFVDYTDAASTGTKMPRTKWSDMAEYIVALPSIELATSFSKMVKPWISNMLIAIHESRTLAAQRDALLPKLVSGEVGVNGVCRWTST